MANIEFDLDDFFSRIDFDAIENSSNKVARVRIFSWLGFCGERSNTISLVDQRLLWCCIQFF